MTPTPVQQMAELLIQKTIGGLSLQEQQNLDRLQRDNNVSDSDLQSEMDRIELAAAAADLASFQIESDTMPDYLKDRVLIDAGKHFESTGSSAFEDDFDEHRNQLRSSPQDSGVRTWILATVVATAACILLLINAMNSVTTSPDPALTVAQRMDNFLSSSPADLMDVKMVPGFDSTADSMIDGRLVWSDKLQQGFMEFAGLKKNDPTKEVYQLWIFESPTQAHPIDGGVFNITDERQVVEIRPNIKADAMLFAVTVEKPPGVMVSNRERIATADPVLAEAVKKLLAEQESEQ